MPLGSSRADVSHARARDPPPMEVVAMAHSGNGWVRSADTLAVGAFAGRLAQFTARFAARPRFQRSISSFPGTGTHAGKNLRSWQFLLHWPSCGVPWGYVWLSIINPVKRQGSRDGCRTRNHVADPDTAYLGHVATPGSSVRCDASGAASQEFSAHRHADECVGRCRSSGDRHGCDG